MPISLELVNFTEAFRIFHLKSMAESFRRLGAWLARRVKKADDLDRATAHIPRVWFRDGAVTLWIDASQKDALAPDEPPPSFGDRIKAGGDRFVKGLGDYKVLKDEAQIIPNFFEQLVAALDLIEKSVVKFHRPTAEMFDTGARTASDLFGEAALAWRALYFSKRDLGIFWASVYVLKGPEKKGEGARVESVAALPDMFERFTRYIVAGLLLVPRLPEFVKALWAEASVFIRGKALQEFAGLEQEVFGVRRLVIDIFYVDLRETLNKGLALAAAWGFITTAWVSIFLDLGKTFARQTLDKLGGFFSKLAVFMGKIDTVFHGLEALLKELVEINLMPLLIDKLGWKGWAAELLADPPTITLEDISSEEKRGDANKRLQDWLDKIQSRAGKLAGAAGSLIFPRVGALAGPALEEYLKSQLRPVRRLLNVALGTKTEDVKETAAFGGPLPEFPDIGDVFIKAAEPLRTSLEGFIPSLKAQTMGLIDAGAEALDTIGRRFERAAAAVLRGPSVEKYMTISNAAGRLAEQAMPPTDVEGEGPGASLVAVARSWEEWFFTEKQGALTGFALLGTIIPGYVEAMRKYWADRLERGEEATVRLPDDLPEDFPTSPHIMALRPVLARTLVPRVKIDATGHALDDGLAERVAGAFLDRVREAHRKGMEKLAAFQLAADAESVAL
ncbi:MAG TPA: hypothetical protein VF591_25900 [Pyrinomonadaceae bacterium]|jgi:hypothetical protein